MSEDILKDAKPCPFCGFKGLRVTDWWDEDGEYDAIECCRCKGCAPADVWNRREHKETALPLSVQEALNSGDGVYRP